MRFGRLVLDSGWYLSKNIFYSSDEFINLKSVIFTAFRLLLVTLIILN